MSELSVGSLSGLAANSYVIDVASGSTLDVTNATGTLPSAQLPAGSILQVLDTTTITQASTTSTSYQASGLSVSITPSSTSSKILLQYSVAIDTSADGCHTTIFQDSTNVADGAYTSVATFLDIPGRNIQTVGSSFLDSPATTSAITYTVQFRSAGGGNVLLRNELSRGRLIVMEVAG